MGQTLEDIARLRKSHGKAARLIVRNSGTAARHRDKITIEKLDFFYGKVRAPKNICLALPERQVTGMIGPSGCGKSTLLRVLNRIYSTYPGQRATGSVLLDGADIVGPHVDMRRLRSRVGMVFQEITVFPMSIYQSIAYGIRLHEHLSRADLSMRVEEALTRVGRWAEVKDRLESPVDALSGGQQQRLCIARSRATRPEVLLLDEPTSALDPISAAMIENSIDDIKLTVTVVLVTHNLQQAARCADRVAFFYLGELIEAGTAMRIFSAPREARTQDYVTGRFG